MRLHNMLTLDGGVPEQGREVSFRVRYPGPNNVPHVRDIVGVLYPLSSADAKACAARAQEKAKDPSASLDVNNEYVIQVLTSSLRDPSDLSKRLIEDERDANVLRAGLVPAQYEWFLAEYKVLLDTEYPGLVTDKDEKDMGEEARGFSASDQPARG